MAKRNLEATTLVLTYENGVDSKGDIKTTKKSYSNIKLNSTVDAIYATANALKSAMDATVTTISVAETSSISNE